MLRSLLALFTLAAGTLAGCIPEAADGTPIATATPAELGLTVENASPITIDLRFTEEAAEARRQGAAWVLITAARDLEIVDIFIDGDAGRLLPGLTPGGDLVELPDTLVGWELVVQPPRIDDATPAPAFYRQAVDAVRGQQSGPVVALELEAGQSVAVEVGHEHPGGFELSPDPIGGHLVIETAEGSTALPIVTLR